MKGSTVPGQSATLLKGGVVWIVGKLSKPPEGVRGPLVFGSDWLLEMVRNDRGRTFGFFWAPFAIINESTQFDYLANGSFVGFSAPTPPPARWLSTSMMFDLGTLPLARTPDEFIGLIAEARPYVRMESAKASSLSQEAKRLIGAHFRGGVSIASAARTLGVSHAHLTRQFKRDFGITPVEYSRRLRVSEAMSRLSRGEPIVDAGYDAGFNDTARFYSAFRKVNGTSPGKCRAARR